METTPGHLARLPDGQRVRIESHEGETATLRRIDGRGGPATSSPEFSGCL